MICTDSSTDTDAAATSYSMSNTEDKEHITTEIAKFTEKNKTNLCALRGLCGENPIGYF